MAKRAGTSKKKEDIAYNHLWEMICSDKYDVGDLLPTEMVIAEELGINRLTVSKALAWLKKEGYIYRRAGFGTVVERKPPSSNTRMILVISPWPSWNITENWYFSRLLYAIHAEALFNHATTVNVAFQTAETKKEDFYRIRDIYSAVKCEGALVIDPFMSTHERLIDFLKDLGCPSVWVDSSLDSYGDVHKVDIDNFQSSYDLTKRLIDDGAKKVSFLGGSLNTTARKQRFEGYKKAVEDSGIEFDERFIICTNSNSYLEEAGNECAGIYAARRLDADAIFLNDSTMISGILDFCKMYPNESTEKLIQLPIATYDYQGEGGNVKYNVTQPIEEVGRQSVQLFLNDLETNGKKRIHRKVPVDIQSF